MRDSAVTRICAVAGFFVSIPVFLTGPCQFSTSAVSPFPLVVSKLTSSLTDIVLYTILQFPSTPAITTSIVISVGIVLCGCAMLHNIVVWHRVREWRHMMLFWPSLLVVDFYISFFSFAAQEPVDCCVHVARSFRHWKASRCRRQNHVTRSDADGDIGFKCSERQSECQLEQSYARAFYPGLKKNNPLDCVYKIPHQHKKKWINFKVITSSVK